MTPGELRELWTARREMLDKIGAYVDGPRIIGEFLADVAELNDRERKSFLSLKDAAALSGYSVEHLGRLVREGRIRNHGRKGAPRVRADELPSRRLALSRARSYDVDTDARKLRNERQ
jgi:hypothetical protein